MRQRLTVNTIIMDSMFTRKIGLHIKIVFLSSTHPEKMLRGVVFRISTYNVYQIRLENVECFDVRFSLFILICFNNEEW